MGRFRNFIKELKVKGHKTPLDGHHIISFRQYVWVLDKDNFDQYKDQISNALGIDVPDDIYELETEIREQHPDVIMGQINNGKLYMSVDNWRQSSQSPAMMKLLKQLKLRGVDISYLSSATNDSEEMTFGAEHFNQVKNTKFYHGTSYKGLQGILRTGLMPKGHESNFNKIKHFDKIFVTNNLEKAEFHAFQASRQKEDFPLIIELTIPDPAKLVFDYDFAMMILGKNHKTTDTLGYSNKSPEDNQFLPNVSKRNQNNVEGLARSLGVFGYLGRIPPKFITDIHYDPEPLERFIQSQEYGDYDPEDNQFEPVSRWQEDTPKEFKQTVNDIHDEINSYEDEDEV